MHEGELWHIAIIAELDVLVNMQIVNQILPTQGVLGMRKSSPRL